MKREMKRFLAMVGWATIVLSFVSNAYALQYTITDLGVATEDGFWNSYTINNVGQIAGNSPSGAFLWDNGQKTYMGEGWASDINDLGQIAFNSDSSSFIWQNGVRTELPLMEAYKINNSGQVSGLMSWSTVLWDKGAITYMEDLDSSVSPDEPFGLNDLGQVVGYAESWYGPWSVMWENGKIVMKDPGAGGVYSPWAAAFSINNNSQIVGWDGYTWQAVLWENGLRENLGSLADGGNGSVAFEINDSGQVVGSSNTASGQDHAFLWDKIAGMIDLNTLVNSIDGWTLSSATDINERGQIVGYGKINGETHGYLLNPTPEPATMTLLGLGMIGLGVFGRKLKTNKIS